MAVTVNTFRFRIFDDGAPPEYPCPADLHAVEVCVYLRHPPGSAAQNLRGLERVDQFIFCGQLFSWRVCFISVDGSREAAEEVQQFRPDRLAA